MKTFGAKVVSAVNVSNKSWANIGWAALLTALGAGLTYLTGIVGEIDMQQLGKWGPLVMTIVVPLLSYAKNKIQELLKNNVAPDPEPTKPNELDFNMIKQNKA